MDIDHPEDIAMFAGLDLARGTRTLSWLHESGVLTRL
jgi:hypothetical protein